jgi:hypothetical protein
MPRHAALFERTQAALPLRRRCRRTRWLAQTKMPGGGKDNEDRAIEVEVAKDSIDAYSEARARQQRINSALDPEAMDAGFKFMQQLDQMQQEQRTQQDFDRAFNQPRIPPSGPAAPSIPWTSIVGITLGALILTGKLNLFTLIGEAVSGLVLFAVGVPLAMAGAGFLWFKTQTVQGVCPVCSTDCGGIKNQATICLNCGTTLVVEDDKFVRASDFNTQTDAQTGRQTVVKNVMDVDVEVIDEKDK